MWAIFKRIFKQDAEILWNASFDTTWNIDLVKLEEKIEEINPSWSQSNLEDKILRYSDTELEVKDFKKWILPFHPFIP
jgi:hypothetical protein